MKKYSCPYTLTALLLDMWAYVSSWTPAYFFAEQAERAYLGIPMVLQPGDEQW